MQMSWISERGCALAVHRGTTECNPSQLVFPLSSVRDAISHSICFVTAPTTIRWKQLTEIQELGFILFGTVDSQSLGEP